MNSQRETKNIVQFTFYKKDIYSIKNYHYDITALLLKVALNTINQTTKSIEKYVVSKYLSIKRMYFFDFPRNGYVPIGSPKLLT